MHSRAVVVVALLMWSLPAKADELTATRNQPLFEASHTVDIAVADGVATYTVQRMFSNPGTVADQVELAIDLPYGAAATGLRIRANDRWYAGVLMEREAAAALYQEMTGYGSAVAKDPALLAWRWADKLSLQVFPVMPGTVSTIEYTLTAPTRYEGGRYFVSYPRVGAPDPAEAAEAATRARPLATPVVTVRPRWGGARTAVVIDGKRVARDTPIVLLPPPREPWQDQIATDPSASYVASTIEVPSDSRTQRAFATATIALELPHTYQSDLRVELLTPAGERVPLHDRSGGSDNDVRGTHVATLPRGTIGAGRWRLVVSDHAALDTGTLDRWSITLGTGKDLTTVASADTPVFVPDAPESASEAGIATISIAPPPIRVLGVRFGRVVASDKHAFARVEVDVAPQLVPMPVRAQVVFVLDTSYTQGEAGVTAQLAIVRAYASHVPDAEVELVTYQRNARRVFGRFVPVAGLTDAIAVARHRGAFALGNGSALDDGAKLAAATLASRTGPRRLVAMTDELVRPALVPTLALAALTRLPADAVVHVVVPRLDRDDRVELARDDQAVFAPLATRHHGIYVELTGLPAPTLKALAPAVLELVRPTRVDHLAITGFELDRTVLQEGDGLRLMIDRPVAPTRITLTGMLWSDPLTRTLAASTAFSRQTAAFVFGADEHGALSDAEQMKIAMFGRAVSPVTSYVAAEPGVRPSTIGFDLSSIGAGGYGTIGHGSGGGGGIGRIKPDPGQLIDLAGCLAQVRPTTAWTAALTIDTTRDEIVDVVAGTADAMTRCLAETTWKVRLPASTYVLPHERFDVELSGPAFGSAP